MKTTSLYLSAPGINSLVVILRMILICRQDCIRAYSVLRTSYSTISNAEPRTGLNSAPSGVPGVTCRSSLSACPGFLRSMQAEIRCYAGNLLLLFNLRSRSFFLVNSKTFSLLPWRKLEKALLAIAPLLAWCFPFSIPSCPSLSFWVWAVTTGSSSFGNSFCRNLHL